MACLRVPFGIVDGVKSGVAGSDGMNGKRANTLSSCALDMSAEGLVVVDFGGCELFVGCGGLWHVPAGGSDP